MTNLQTSTEPDPCPQPPERPLPSDCCDSGCTVCVHDPYDDEVAAYRQALADWTSRHPGCGTADDD